jgi:hypothetical protein
MLNLGEKDSSEIRFDFLFSDLELPWLSALVGYRHLLVDRLDSC